MTYQKVHNEEDLLRSVQKGDKRAEQAFYCRYVRYLTAICGRYVPRDEDVKDVMQEAFLKIFSAIGSFELRGEGTLKSWLAKVVVNESLKFVRSHARYGYVELTELEERMPDDEPDPAGIPSNLIYEMIRSLPDGYRIVFNLFAIEGKSHKDIALLLGISENTSASQFHRAKALLARKIEIYKKDKMESE